MLAVFRTPEDVSDFTCDEWMSKAFFPIISSRRLFNQNELLRLYHQSNLTDCSIRSLPTTFQYSHDILHLWDVFLSAHHYW